jgi:hypothetical protein
MDILTEAFDPGEALASDKEGRVLRALADHLEDEKRNLKKSMDKGVPGGEFAVLDNLGKACDNAQTIVRHAWSRRNS